MGYLPVVVASCLNVKNSSNMFIDTLTATSKVSMRFSMGAKMMKRNFKVEFAQEKKLNYFEFLLLFSNSK